MKSFEIAQQAAYAALEKKGTDVLLLDLEGLSTIADFFILCTGESSRQLDAIKENIRLTLSKQGHKVLHIEGEFSQSKGIFSGQELNWILMDYGDIVVHIMDQAAREFYQLDRLWADAPRTRIEDTLAPSQPEEKRSSSPAQPPSPGDSTQG